MLRVMESNGAVVLNTSCHYSELGAGQVGPRLSEAHSAGSTSKDVFRPSLADLGTASEVLKLERESAGELLAPAPRSEVSSYAAMLTSAVSDKQVGKQYSSQHMISSVARWGQPLSSRDGLQPCAHEYLIIRRMVASQMQARDSKAALSWPPRAGGVHRLIAMDKAWCAAAGSRSKLAAAKRRDGVAADLTGDHLVSSQTGTQNTVGIEDVAVTKGLDSVETAELRAKDEHQRTARSAVVLPHERQRHLAERVSHNHPQTKTMEAETLSLGRHITPVGSGALIYLEDGDGGGAAEAGGSSSESDESDDEDLDGY